MLDKGLCSSIVYSLVIAGADVDIRDSDGFTVLHRAFMITKLHNINFIRCLLIFASANCDSRTRYGKTALHLRAQSGEGQNTHHTQNAGHRNDVDSGVGDGIIVSALIHSGDMVNSIDDYGVTPLYYATGTGHVTIVQALLRAGANPNLSDRNHRLPLHTAIACYRIEVFETLLEAGANIDAPNAEGCTPLHLAVRMDGGNNFVQILIQHNCDLNLGDNNGTTALHCTVTRGKKAYINALLLANANVNIQDEIGMTPLHYAVSTHYTAAMASLESLSRTMVDMHITDRYGRTALHYALIKKARTDIIYFLIRRDPTQVNFD